MRINEAVWMEKYNRWQINIQKEGKRKSFYCSAPGKKGKIECEKKADKWLESGISSTTMRFGAAYKMFLEDKKENLSYATWRKYKSTGNTWLLPALEYHKLSTITVAMLDKITASAYRKGRAKRTIGNIKGALSSFATFCKNHNWEFVNISAVTVSKKAPIGKRTILQAKEINALFNNPSDEYYIFAWRFLVLTGLRRGELCGLMHKDINGSVAYINRAITEHGDMTDGKTESAVRPAALCKKALEILDQQAAMLKKMGIISPYVFPNKNGNHSSPNTIYSAWSRYRKTIGVTCSLHELRHTLISYVESSVPEMLLKKVVGHSESMDTHGTYGHHVDDEAIKAAALFDERFEDII